MDHTDEEEEEFQWANKRRGIILFTVQLMGPYQKPVCIFVVVGFF